VLCVVRDIVDPVQDQRLAEFVVGSHARSHPEADEDDQQQPGQQQQPLDGTIPQDMLRKYITFAKQQYRPTMSQVGGVLYVRLTGEDAGGHVGQSRGIDQRGKCGTTSTVRS
jgi:DNA replication licensing factor MCM2